MSEDKRNKGMSLRRKKTTRPTISAPRPVIQANRDRSADSRWDAQTTASKETRPSIGSRDQTSDLVKRRYSTRFAGGLPQDGFVPPVPAMPSLPAQFSKSVRQEASRSPSRDGRSQSRTAEGKIRVDPRALTDPNLMAEKYVQSILAEATENDVTAFQDELQKLKLHTSTDLQHNVFQNRTQFIRVSKEADKLKSEMQTLRSLMNEMTTTLGQATSAGGADVLNGNNALSVADRKRAHRTSVANLEAMWSTHLQTLWKRVEGSQKYLPALPGRHIIMESQRWVELNAATWKPRRRVCLVLLNDHLLIASEKKRNDLTAAGQTPEGKSNRQSMYSPGSQKSQTNLVSERCWQLQDVSLVDISRQSTTVATDRENKAIANAINIRVGNESFTYATNDSAEKASLIVAFRKAQEDLRKKMAAEHGERERALDELAMLTGRDPRGLKKAAAIANSLDEGGLSRSNSVLIDADGRQTSVRYVESQVDSLDIDIALQRFEEAVGKIEKLRKLGRSIKGNATAQDIIMAKVNDRAAKLASSIARQLVLTSAKMDKTIINVSWLLRLGYEEMARTRYLQSRTDTIHLRTRQLPFTGALPPYMHALSYTTFTLLLHTFRSFSASFPQASGSAVVKWAKERVDEFNAHMLRQLSGINRDSATWRESIEAVEQQASVLSEVGVDFTALIWKNLDGKAIAQPAVQSEQAVGLGLS